MKSLVEELCNRHQSSDDDPRIFLHAGASEGRKWDKAQEVLIRLCHLDTMAYDWVKEFRPDVFPVEAPKTTVTVCDKCLQASCWQGIFMCQESSTAGITEKTIEELRELDRENPCYWEL